MGLEIPLKITSKLLSIEPYYYLDIQTSEYFNKLVSFFLKNGKLNKQVKLLVNILSYIYTYTSNNLYGNFQINTKYFNVREFIFILNNTNHLNNISTILK